MSALPLPESILGIPYQVNLTWETRREYPLLSNMIDKTLTIIHDVPDIYDPLEPGYSWFTKYREGGIYTSVEVYAGAAQTIYVYFGATNPMPLYTAVEEAVARLNKNDLTAVKVHERPLLNPGEWFMRPYFGEYIQVVRINYPI